MWGEEEAFFLWLSLCFLWVEKSRCQSGNWLKIGKKRKKPRPQGQQQQQELQQSQQPTKDNKETEAEEAEETEEGNIW